MKKIIIASLALISASAFAQPLLSQPVKQYECLVNGNQGLLGYFIPRMPPEPIPYSSNPVIVCHDTQYGPYDGASLPRRNEKEASFKVWDGMNPLFFDNDGDGNMDVNNRIIRYASQYGANIPRSTNFFTKLKVRNHELGYIMPAFVDQTTFKSYCLSSMHYHSSNPLFKALGEVLGSDTEGLYVGQRLRGDRELLYVSESVVKKSWFYLANNKPAIPTDHNVSSVQVFFVYEGDVFQIKGIQELNIPDLGNGNYPSHDRKIGCVPKM